MSGERRAGFEDPMSAGAPARSVIDEHQARRFRGDSKRRRPVLSVIDEHQARRFRGDWMSASRRAGFGLLVSANRLASVEVIRGAPITAPLSPIWWSADRLARFAVPMSANARSFRGDSMSAHRPADSDARMRADGRPNPGIE